MFKTSPCSNFDNSAPCSNRNRNTVISTTSQSSSSSNSNSNIVFSEIRQQRQKDCIRHRTPAATLHSASCSDTAFGIIQWHCIQHHGATAAATAMTMITRAEKLYTAPVFDSMIIQYSALKCMKRKHKSIDTEECCTWIIWKAHQRCRRSVL